MDVVPDYIEPLRGFRVWHVRDGSELESLCGTAWPPFEALEARGCTASPAATVWAVRTECDGPPCDDTGQMHHGRCGIYAFSTRDALLRTIRQESFLLRRWPVVVGEVWLWGRVAQHEYGYRAQYAYPARFIGGFGCDPVPIAYTYGVPYEEDPSCTSVGNSVALWRSQYESPFPATPVRQRDIPTAATPILPAVWLGHRPRHQARTGEPLRHCRSILSKCRRLAARSCSSEVLRLLTMIRGSRAS